MTKSCLVVGGAGFIGSHLCDHLIDHDCQVHCLDNLHLGTKENIRHLLDHDHFAFHHVDACDEDALDRIFSTHHIDTVFHMAANSDIQKGAENIAIDLELTFNTTIHLLNVMKHHHVPEIIFASSSAIYGQSDEPLSESSAPNFPQSFYGAAKLASEAFISAFCDQYPLRAWMVRFPNVIGERLTHGVIFDFIKKLKSSPNELVILGNGKQKKPYIYVKDLIDGIMTFYNNARTNRAVINIGVDTQTTVDEIADMVIQEMGLEDVKKTYTGGSQGWVGDVPEFQYDLTHIHALGWRALKRSSEAVRHTIQAELKNSHA